MVTLAGGPSPVLLYAITGVLHSGKSLEVLRTRTVSRRPKLWPAAECLPRNAQLVADGKCNGGHAHDHHDRQHRERQEPDAAPPP